MPSGAAQRFKARDKIRSAPQVGGLATPLPFGGSPTLQSRGQYHKCPTSLQIGFVTTTNWGVPNGSEQRTKSELANKWADGLHHPCRLGGPQPTEWRTKSRVACTWADWLCNPWCLGSPQHLRAEDNISFAPQVGGWATPPLPFEGSPLLRSGVQQQKCPTSGCIGYVTPAI